LKTSADRCSKGGNTPKEQPTSGRDHTINTISGEFSRGEESSSSK